MDEKVERRSGRWRWLLRGVTVLGGLLVVESIMKANDARGYRTVRHPHGDVGLMLAFLVIGLIGFGVLLLVLTPFVLATRAGQRKRQVAAKAMAKEATPPRPGKHRIGPGSTPPERTSPRS